MNYTHPMPTDVEGMTDFLKYTNTLTDGGFAPSILLVIFVIAFTSFKVRRYPVNDSIAASVFVTTAASILLWAAGLLPEMWIILLTVATAAAVFLYSGNNGVS